MLYEKGREFAQLNLQHWLSNEVFSLGWFVMVGILIVFYAVWLKLLDKSRAKELLLIGALAAVFYHINIILLIQNFGFVEYKIKLFPIQSAVFMSSVTLAPIILMLAQQYTSSWKGYILWSGIGIAFLNFIIFPILMALGILQFHNWNVFFHFITLFAIAQFTRLIFLWIAGTQKRHSEKQKY